MLGHVGPMACSGMEASEGRLLSGPLSSQGFSSPMPQGREHFPFKAAKLPLLMQLVSPRH